MPAHHWAALGDDDEEHTETRELPPLYLELLLPYSPLLLTVIKTIREKDNIIPTALIHLFSAQASAMQLFRIAIEHEVDLTLSEGTLFRGNSPTTKMLSLYADQFGRDYMVEVLRPPILRLLASDESLEVNPERAQGGDDVSANMEHLLAICRDFYSCTVGTKDKMPLTFRKICCMLFTIVSEKFPNAGPIAVGGFVFLRFLIPAINIYQIKGIADTPPSKNQKRILVLVSKVLQNLANQVDFGGKEAYMAPANQFVLENRQHIRSLFIEFATVPQCRHGEIRYVQPHVFVTQAQIATALMSVGQHVYMERAQIHTELEALEAHEGADVAQIRSLRQAIIPMVSRIRIPASENPDAGPVISRGGTAQILTASIVLRERRGALR